MKRRFHIPVALVLLAMPAIVFVVVVSDWIVGDIEHLAKVAERADARVVENNVLSGLSACVERAKHAAETAVDMPEAEIVIVQYHFRLHPGDLTHDVRGEIEVFPIR